MVLKKVLAMLFLWMAFAACVDHKNANNPSTQATTSPATISVTGTSVTAILLALPTSIPSTPTAPPSKTYQDRLDYAKNVLRNHYLELPYVDPQKEEYTLEYHGCVDANDFGGLIAFRVNFPIEVVDKTFAEYFNEHGWESIEATTVRESKIETISYKASLGPNENKTVFEEITVVLYDETPTLHTGEYQTTIRSFFSHLESKERFNASANFGNCKMWFAFNSGW